MTKEVLDYVSAIGSVVTPILLVLLGGIGWLIKRSFDRSQSRRDAQTARIIELEDKLRQDRIATYDALLEPFFLIFTTDAAFAQDPKYEGKDKNKLAFGKMLSVEYRRVGFRLSLVANDPVVRSYNRLMQYVYHDDTNASPLDTKSARWIELLGELLLEIRRSMGNEFTQLSCWEMVEWFIKDVNLMKSLVQSGNT